jgi:hypothetical protein
MDTSILNTQLSTESEKIEGKSAALRLKLVDVIPEAKVRGLASGLGIQFRVIPENAVAIKGDTAIGGQIGGNRGAFCNPIVKVQS